MVLQGILLKLILSGFYVKILGQILMSVLMRMESLPRNSATNFKWILCQNSHEKKTKSATNFTSVFQHPLNLFQVQVSSSIQSLFKFITSSGFFFNSILVDPWLSQSRVRDRHILIKVNLQYYSSKQRQKSKSSSFFTISFPWKIHAS